MWKGRTFQLFFIWLICIELILGWENLQVNKIKKLQSIRTIGFITTLTLPTIYVVASFYWGLNNAITDLATQSRIQWASSMPLSTEYLIFTILFCLIVYLSFGFKGLKYYSVPAFFAAIVGCLYTVDNIFPYGQFTPFQIFVPTTTALAAAILNFIGYPTSITFGQNSLAGNMPFLTAVNPNIIGNPSTTFAIAWPCAGIESFLLFTVVALLFIKRINFSFKVKIGYFVFGAVVTYLINVLRVVNIFLIGMSQGANSLEVDLFHFYYGPLYAVTWIIAYPLIIILSQNLWHRIKKANQPKTTETRAF
jgi:thaumarchaeosortase